MTALLSDGTLLSAERLLSAVGVVANVSGLGLDALGVALPHPTVSEALHEAVLAARDGAIHA